VPFPYSPKDKRAILGELAEYRLNSGLSWQSLADKVQNSIGGLVYWNTLRRVCLCGRAADTTVRKIESFLKRVKANAA